MKNEKQKMDKALTEALLTMGVAFVLCIFLFNILTGMFDLPYNPYYNGLAVFVAFMCGAKQYEKGKK